MGFLRNPRKRRRGKSSGDDAEDSQSDSAARDIKRSKTQQAELDYKQSERKLDHLPAEILQHIFIQSKNFALSECSHSCYSKLAGGSRYLAMMMLHQLYEPEADTKGLQVDICSRRFITAELLSEVGITHFFKDCSNESSPCVIPDQLDNLCQNQDSSTSATPRTTTEAAQPRIDTRRLELSLYLLDHGCVNNTHGDLLLSAIKCNNTAAVEQLLHRKVKYDSKSLITAFEMGHNDLAARLLDSSGDIELWDYITSTKNIRLFNFLRKSGIVPPYHSII